MLIDIQSALRSFEGVRKFDDYLAEFIRSDRHDELEAMLEQYLATIPGPVTDACTTTSLDQVRIVGWGAIERRLGIVHNYTAVGIDLSTYVESFDEEGTLRVALETNYYTDEAFEFSTGTRAVITAAGRRSPVWRGGFSEVEVDLRVEGLDRLHSLLASTRSDARSDHRMSIDEQCTVSDSAIGQSLGEWWVVLRLHQAVRRDLAKLSLVRRIPIIIGNHGNYPELSAVYYPSSSGARPDPVRPDRPKAYGPGGAGASEPEDDARKTNSEKAAERKAAKDAAVERILSRFSSIRVSGLDPHEVEDLTNAAKLVGNVLRKRFDHTKRH